MKTNSKFFIWKGSRKPFYKNLSVIASVIIACNIFAASAYLHLNPAKAQVLGVVSGKDGYKLRYSKTTNGALTFSGNSLCLSDASAQGTCATFITTDQTLSDSPYSKGTTNDWTKNASTSQVKLPQGSEVLYAELIWGGSYKYTTTDLTDQLDKPITLKTPTGTFNITPDINTSAQVSESSAYVRTANVTDIVAKSGAGTYTAGSIPATMDRTNPYNNYAGWTLAIAYRDLKQPPRNLSIFVGSEQAGPDQLSNIAEVKGFATPTSGQISGRLLVSAQEGDPCYSGDQIKFGSTKTNLAALSGPNNQKSNFFASQINGDDGKLSTSGSFGGNNQNPASCGNNKRQGWDTTNVDISAQLSNNQTTAYAQGTSQGDVYMINGLGIQIDVNAAKPEIQLQVDKAEAKVGDTLTYTMQVKNTGTTDSNNSNLSALIPDGTSFVDGSMIVDGVKNPTSSSSLNLGSVKPSQTVNVQYQVKIDKIPSDSKFVNQANLDYEYTMVIGDTPVKDSTKSNEVVTIYSDKPNVPPVALDDTAQTTKDTMVTINVLSNDTDQDGNLEPNSLVVTKNPSNGSFLIVDGKINYTPKSNFAGNDTFNYKICDTKNLCDEAKVDVIVTSKPEAVDDNANTAVNIPVDINILQNDIYNSKGQIPTIKTISEPKNGKVNYGETGKAIYTPNPDYSGNDTFEYQICDDTKLCDNALVNIVITKPQQQNNPPIAQDDGATTKMNQEVIIPALVNDSDLDGNLNPDSIKVIKNPSNGSVEIVNQNVKYIPNRDFVGNDIFEYQVCDSLQSCDSASVNVVISPIETPKPIENSTVKAQDDTNKTKVNIPVTTKVITNDTTSSNFDLSKFKIVIQPTKGQAVVSSDGSITYKPNLDYEGDDIVTYEICNTENICSQAKLNISVIKENVIVLPKLYPVVAVDDEASTTVNTNVFIPVLNNDSAPNDKLDFSSIKVTKNATNGTLIADQTTGKINYKPNLNFTGTDIFIYEICNTQSPKQCASATVKIKVTEMIQGIGNTPGITSTPSNTPYVEPKPQTPAANPDEGNVVGAKSDQPETLVTYTINENTVDKQSELSSTPKKPGQVLGISEIKQLVRTGGEYGTKVFLPLNIILVLFIFGLNQIQSKKELEELN